MQYSGINDPLTCDITAEEFARLIPGNSQPQNHHYQTRRAAKMQSYATYSSNAFAVKLVTGVWVAVLQTLH